jgi:hypothetical protein
MQGTYVKTKRQTERKQFATANKPNRYHYLNKIYITAQHTCIARIVYFIYLFIDYIAVIGKLGNFLSSTLRRT